MSTAPISASLAHALKSASGAALFFLAWDTCITFDDEVECIWSKPRSSWIKWLFFFVRYFALAVQLCNRAIDMAIMHKDHLGFRALRAWYIGEVMVALLSMSGVEIIMMARVYALYNRHRWVGIGFIALLTAELITVIIGVVLTIPGVKFHISSLTTSTPASFVYFGIAVLVSQVTILTLTVTKYSRGLWGQAPVIKLMMRDGTLAFATLFILSMVLIIYTTLNISFAGTGYAWLVSIVSSAGCRLILNMQRLPETQCMTARDALQFTTVFSETVFADQMTSWQDPSPHPMSSTILLDCENTVM